MLTDNVLIIDPRVIAENSCKFRKRCDLLTVFLIFLSFVSIPAHAQTARLMDEALASRELNYTQAAYFVLAAAERIPINSDVAAAFSYAAAQRWLPKKAAADAPVKLGELSHLIMQAFALRGGFLYRLFTGPRYAYREMVYLRLIPPPSDPAKQVLGEQFFHILGNVLTLVGETPILDGGT